MEMADATTTQAVEELKRKQDRRTRWSKIGGAVVMIALVIRLGIALFAPAEAQACDATEVRSSLTDLVDQATAKGGSTAKVATLSNFTTVQDDAALRRCTSHVALSDKSEGTLTYHVDPKTVTIDRID